MPRRKLDFGSGHKPRRSYASCDITGLAEFYFDPFEYRLHAPNEYFDEIIAFNVLHHIQDLNRVAAELIRCLKIGGKLIIAESKEDLYAANCFLDYLWYRWLIPRPEIWWSKKYRNWKEAFKELELLVDDETEASDVLILRRR